MSNNGSSFVPQQLAAPVTVVGAPKPILGHVVQASSSSMNPVNFGGGDTNQPAHPKDKYKWHTVVDGFSKSIKNNKYNKYIVK